MGIGALAEDAEAPRPYMGGGLRPVSCPCIRPGIPARGSAITWRGSMPMAGRYGAMAGCGLRKGG